MGNLNEFFSWTKKERIALIILSALLLILISGNLFFDRIYISEDYSIHPDTLLVYEAILKKWEQLEFKPDENKPFAKIENSDEVNKESFDPNTIDINGWMEYGFSRSQSESLINYKNAIGGFKTKEDLKKSYVLSETRYAELEALIKIDQRESNVQNTVKIKEDKRFQEENKVSEEAYLLFDLNECDSVSLLKLKGIGPYYAGKIVAYGKELGGYVSKRQLLEIWNFDSLKLIQIEDHISISLSEIRKIAINSDSIEVFKSHPYITYNIAKAIVNYRTQHGEFTQIDDLKQIRIIDDVLLNKIYPYLTLD